MGAIMIIVGAACFIMLNFIPAPYGRYSNPVFGYLINAKLAWFIQEIPAFLVPLLLVLLEDFKSKINALILLCFTIHYAQR